MKRRTFFSLLAGLLVVPVIAKPEPVIMRAAPDNREHPELGGMHGEPVIIDDMGYGLSGCYLPHAVADPGHSHSIYDPPHGSR